MESRFVTVAGSRIHYHESGNGSPVVLVHGNFGSSRWWERTMDIPGHRALALDLPNFGHSDRLEIADIDAYAEHLGAFIDALGLGAPALVGHSLGGSVVMALAQRRPGICGPLVLVDSAPPGGLVTAESHYPILERCRTDRGLLRMSLAAVAPSMDDPAFLDALVDDASLMAPIAFSGNARSLAARDGAAAAPALAAFGKPVLVVWGKRDALVTETMARETAAAFPGAELRALDGVGHSVMAEAPGLFVEILSSFLETAKS